jgi:two-component system, sensor histidine kinase PdtaS
MRSNRIRGNRIISHSGSFFELSNLLNRGYDTAVSSQSSREPAPHLLLVEDEAIIALAEQAVLKRNGYQVTRASSGEAAVEAVRSRPDVALVLMDIDLGPGIDGTRAASLILEERSLPIVFLTNHSEKEMVERVRGITRYGYVLKNSGEFVLLQAIEMAFELFRAQSQAEAGEALYRSITNLTGEIIVQHDQHGVWTFLSDGACEFFGKPREELLGRSFLEFVHPDDREHTANDMGEITTRRRATHRRMNRQLSSAGWRTVEWNSEIVRDALGAVIGFQATGRDVTEREEQTRRLHFHQQLTTKLMDTAPVALLVFDRTGTISYANEAASRLFGRPAEQLTGRSYTSEHWKIRSEDGTDLRDGEHPFQLVMETGTVISGLRLELERPDGTRSLLRVSVAPLPAADGSIDGTVTVIEDISAEFAAERELERSERNFRLLFEHATSGIILANDQSVVVDCNETAARILGYPKNELVGEQAYQLIRREDLEKQSLRDTMGRARETAEPFESLTIFPRAPVTCSVSTTYPLGAE